MEHQLSDYDVGDTFRVEHIPEELTVVGRDRGTLVVEGETKHKHDCKLYLIHAKSEVEDEWDAHETLVMPMYQAEAADKGFL